MGDLKGLIEGEDYYFNERRLLVWTEAYLEKKGRCCYSGCYHCPYDKKLKNKKVDPEVPQELQLDSESKEYQHSLSDEDLASLADQYTKDLP